MRSIQRRFNNISEKKPFWGSYLCFAEAVKGQSFGKQTIHRWFQKLVDKNDYARSEKKGVLGHLENLSSAVRTAEIKDKPVLQSGQNAE